MGEYTAAQPNLKGQKMAGAHQNLEHAEHAAHSGHISSNKLFGVTMALIGVLIAVRGLMVGSERNEFTRTMIEQTQAHSDYSGASTKFRLVMIELEKQHARIAAARDPQGGPSPVERFIQLATEYTAELHFSKLWTDSFQPVVDAHFKAAEGYEKSQLVAEIAIVLASLAVLLSSRAAWMISVIVAVLALLPLRGTRMKTGRIVEKAQVLIHQAEEAYNVNRKAHSESNDDEKAIERLDPDKKIRQAIDLRAKASRKPINEAEAAK